jgi:hypothetical protein
MDVKKQIEPTAKFLVVSGVFLFLNNHLGTAGIVVMFLDNRRCVLRHHGNRRYADCDSRRYRECRNTHVWSPLSLANKQLRLGGHRSYRNIKGRSDPARSQKKAAGRAVWWPS